MRCARRSGRGREKGAVFGCWGWVWVWWPCLERVKCVPGGGCSCVCGVAQEAAPGSCQQLQNHDKAVYQYDPIRCRSCHRLVHVLRMLKRTTVRSVLAQGNGGIFNARSSRRLCRLWDKGLKLSERGILVSYLVRQLHQAQ